MNPSDQIVANRLATSPDDWTVALRQNEPWLRRVLFNRIGDRDAVDDLIQEISLAVARPELRPDDIARFPAWLYQVAQRQAYQYRRKAGRRRKLTDGAQEEFAARNDPLVDDPLSWVIGHERQQAVRSAISRLSDTDREILMLKYSEGWTYQQLGARLGVTVHTIEHRLLKAKHRLRRFLSEADVEV